MWHQVIAASGTGQAGTQYLSNILVYSLILVPVSIWFIRLLIQNHKRAVAHKQWKMQQAARQAEQQRGGPPQTIMQANIATMRETVDSYRPAPPEERGGRL